jgi:hypothetical protein
MCFKKPRTQAATKERLDNRRNSFLPGWQRVSSKALQFRA